MKNAHVINTWDNNKIVFKGTIETCTKYINGNNIYQSNYSKLKLVIEKTKRTWHYVEGPTIFDLCCPHNNSHNITWSEFEDHIWCFDCETDIEYKPGYSIFPIHVAELMGISFDKFDMITNTYYKYDSKTNTYNAIKK